MKLRNFILITTNLVAITTFSTVSCGKQVEKPIDPVETVVKAFKTTYASVLNKTEDNVTLDDEIQVSQALSTYNNLDTNTKTKLSSEKELLDKLDTKIKQLKAENSGRNNSAPNPPVQDPARSDGNDNQNTGTGNGTEKPSLDIKPKEPNNTTQEPPKEENVPSNPGTSDPAPAGPTKEPTNGDGNQESPKTEPNPTPNPKDPVTEEPGNGGKEPNEEKPNNGADNRSNIENTKDTSDLKTDNNEEETQNQTPDTKPNQPVKETDPDNSGNSQNIGAGNESEQPGNSAEPKAPNSETPQDSDSSNIGDSLTPPTEPKKELQEQQLKITNLVVHRDPSYRDYLFFVLTVTKDLWLKLEKSNFKIAMEPESNRSRVYDDTTNLNPKQKLSENGGNVNFRIFLDYPGLREGDLLTQGNWIITQLSDTKEPGYNLLNKEYKFTIDENKNIKMINN